MLQILLKTWSKRITSSKYCLRRPTLTRRFLNQIQNKTVQNKSKIPVLKRKANPKLKKLFNIKRRNQNTNQTKKATKILPDLMNLLKKLQLRMNKLLKIRQN